MGFKVLSNEVNYTDDGGSFDDQPVATLTVSSTYARDAAAAAVLAKAEREAAEAAKIAAETAETNAETAKTNAETAETNAETAETNSETAETNAASSASASANSATSSANSASTATTKASEASASASTATTKASEASSSATDAANSASSASASKDAALAALDNFDDRYLGQKSSNPSVDNDGDALVAGALYFNTTDDSMKVYEGSTWVAAYASLAGTLLTTNNLSDVASATTSRSNLGLGTAATTAATAYATAAQGTTANNALPKAGGTLTGDINMGNNSLLFGDFRIQRDGNNLIFKHNTNVIALLNSLGNFKVIGDLDSNHAFNYIYTIGGFNPDLVIDFKSSYYKTGGTDSTLAGVVTHARAGNATMVDSNGKIKWAPHNLLIRSEELNLWSQGGTGSAVVNNAVAPDGTTTAATFTSGSTNFQRYILSSGTYTAGDKITYSFWARSDTVTTLPFGINGGTNGANNAIFSSLTVTSTWQLVEFEFTVIGNDSSLYYIIGKQSTNPVNCQLGDVEIWHPHVYRSDLGGMVNNPAQPTGFETYVPTTSSAVYLPRVGHHIYNGSAWVNEGILHESEARTNLVTYSEDFTHSSWTKTSASISSNASTSPDGSLSADAIVPTAVNTNHFLASNAGITSGQSYSFSVFAKAGTQDWLRLAATSALFVNPNHVWFNLASGTVGTASTGVTAAITNVGNGWYLCEWKAVASANGNPQFFMVSESGDGTFGYLGNGSEEAIFVWGAQIEVGSTPSSYIPTSGSTVTRAAETLTVPAVNLPWPDSAYVETTGTELVTNGTFDTDISGWEGYNDTPLWDNGRLYITAPTAFDGARTTLNGVPTTTGKSYKLTWDVELGTLSSVKVDVYGVLSAEGLQGSLTVSATGSYTLYFTAGYSAANIYLLSGNAVGSAWFDNVSIKEVTPPAVSIQMDGRMTYADNGIFPTTQGVFGEVSFFSWQSGLGEFISTGINTGTSRLGQYEAAQRSSTSGGVQITQGGVSDYSPGINVPFNTASIHSPIFIKGATEGTLTTSAYPSRQGLSDLSSTDLLLANTFMGTIGKFRVWDEDLTDTGITGAST